MRRKIYVASSWRNEYQPTVVQGLRQARHQVYDFRHPAPDDNGFSWAEIDPDWTEWLPGEYIEALRHPLAEAGFRADHEAMEWADTFVLVLPCGRSAHLELGWACGQGKRTAILLDSTYEPELMYKEADLVTPSLGRVLAWLEQEQQP